MVELDHAIWTDSGIDVAAGERLILKAEGKFGFADDDALAPEGMAGSVVEAPPLPGAAFAAVIGRIGDTLFAVGAGTDRTVEKGGRLQLGVNIPDRYQQVPFSFRVAVTVIPAPRPRPPDEPFVGNETASARSESTETAAAQVATPAPAAAPAPRVEPPAAIRTAEEVDIEPSFPWLFLIAALAAAVLLALGLSRWHRARIARSTQARLAVIQSLSPDPSGGSRPPPELSPAWPTVGTRWRLDESEPAFGGWAGEEVRDG